MSLPTCARPDSPEIIRHTNIPTRRSTSGPRVLARSFRRQSDGRHAIDMEAIFANQKQGLTKPAQTAHGQPSTPGPRGMEPRRSAESGPFKIPFKNEGRGRAAIGAFLTIGLARNRPLTAASDAILATNCRRQVKSAFSDFFITYDQESGTRFPQVFKSLCGRLTRCSMR
jgi:hypothetical protein